MKKLIVVLIVFMFLVSNVFASPFATIGMMGLSFVNPTAATVVRSVLCVTSPVGVVMCATNFVKGKIVGQVYGEALQEIAEISPEVAESIITYNRLKGYVDSGAVILRELELDENGEIEKGEIDFSNGRNIGKDLGFEDDEDAFAQDVNVEFNKEENYNKVTFGEGGRFWVKIDRGKVAYENIEEGGWMKLDRKGEITEADIIIGEEGGTYIFGDYEPFKLSEGTQLTFKDGVVEIIPGKDNSFNYGDNLVRINEDRVFIFEDKISCLDCNVNDLRLKGSLIFKENGYLISKNSIAEKNKVKLTTKNNDVFIANFDTDISKYDKSWVKISDNIMEVQSIWSEEVEVEFLEGNKLFNVKEEDFLSIKVLNSDYINIINRDFEFEYPLIRVKHENIALSGSTIIQNGDLNFVIRNFDLYSKEIKEKNYVSKDSVPFELIGLEGYLEPFFNYDLKVFDKNERKKYSLYKEISHLDSKDVLKKGDLLKFAVKHPLIAVKYKTGTPLSVNDKKIFLNFVNKKFEEEYEYAPKYLDMYLNPKELKKLPKSEWYGDVGTRRQGKLYPIYDISDDFIEAGLDTRRVIAIASQRAENSKEIINLYNQGKEALIMVEGDYVSPMEFEALGIFGFYIQKGDSGKAILRVKDRYDWFPETNWDKITNWKIGGKMRVPEKPLEGFDSIFSEGLLEEEITTTFQLFNSALDNVGEPYIMNGEWEISEEQFLRYFSLK